MLLTKALHGQGNISPNKVLFSDDANLKGMLSSLAPAVLPYLQCL